VICIELDDSGKDLIICDNVFGDMFRNNPEILPYMICRNGSEEQKGKTNFYGNLAFTSISRLRASPRHGGAGRLIRFFGH
jgi:hypothetical protein